MIIDKGLKQNYINDFILTHRIGLPVKTDYHFHHQFEVIYNLTDGAHCYINDQSLELISLLDDALYHHKNRTFGYQIYGRAKLIEILLLIRSFFHSDELSISHTTDNGTRAIKPILQYIKTYLNDDLCLEHLAQTFHFNKFYFVYAPCLL